MLRYVIITLLSLGILAGAFFGFRALSKKPETERKAPPPVVKGVYVETVKNGPVPLKISSSGQLMPTRSVRLTSEVTGVLESSRFREGVAYRKGEVIFTINNAEAQTNTASLRSDFYTRLLTIMPDLKLDYPDVWQKWDDYLRIIDIQRPLPDLPAFTNDRERNFITANGVITAFQNVRNLEIRSGKHVLRAPFDGVISEAMVQEGGLVAAGQPLGEITSLGDYELELPVNISYLSYLKVGQQLNLRPVEGAGNYKGTIVRINPKADVQSQSIIAYVRVVSDELREGMFLQADIDAGTIDDAIVIDRKLITTDQAVYVVRHDTLLTSVPVEPVYYNRATAIVRGMVNGTVLVSKPLPAAYDGMRVKILQSTPAVNEPGS